MMTPEHPTHRLCRAAAVAPLVLLALAQGAHAQRAFVANVVPSIREALAAPMPAPVVDREYMRQQLQHPRVVDAWVAKRFSVMDLFKARGVTYPAAEIYLRVFKRERVIELWARSPHQETFTLIKDYAICALSGVGPKRQRGDGLTPEGFYYVDFLNPSSSFHLSLHVNYPNAADRLLGSKDALGGDIFIHGGCLTEGCIAVTDDAIKELYWIAVEARAVGQQRIPVHIFPARLDGDAVGNLARVFGEEGSLVDFWRQLKGGYDYFEETHRLPEIRISTHGRYLLPGEEDPIEVQRGPRILGDAVPTPVTTTAVPSNAAGQATTGPRLLGEPIRRAGARPATPDSIPAGVRRP